MIKYTGKTHPIHGACLFFDNGLIEVGVPLDFGIRICHFSFVGERNVFFEQPNEMTDLTTPAGWRVRGGHRLWLAPESQDLYAPDNDPVTVELVQGGVRITQCEDTVLHVIKECTLVLAGESVHITHRITNTGDVRTCALWAVSVMAPGGVEHIPLAVRSGGCDPLHRFAIWDHTTLGDERAEYRKDEVVLTHKPIDARYKLGVGHPAEDARYKLGVGHPSGGVRYKLPWVTFVKHYELQKDKCYPDGNVSYETFLCRHMTELESLSPLYTLKKGESATHKEMWTLLRRGRRSNYGN